ncbi:MAG: zf-TFIIB domain-containing protein [Pseudomonadota bacterium]
MQCPKCFSEMARVDDGTVDVTVHRCESCSGLLIERLTRSNLDDMIMAVAFDIGDEVNTELDEMMYVDCPRCDLMMDQQLNESPRIKIEICHACNGAYLDAGELRAYTEPSVLESFRALLPE